MSRRGRTRGTTRRPASRSASLLVVLPLAGITATVQPRQSFREYATPGYQDQGVPSFRSASSELVVLPTVVMDKRGQLVPDLPREQFVVYDNGRPQPIALFSNEDTPVSIALVIDDSGSMRTKLGEVIAAALALAKASNPEDELLIVEFNDSARDALDGRRIRAADLPDLEAALRTLLPQGRTALYDGVLDGLAHVEQSHLPRKAIVLVSDGADNASSATADEVLSRARRSDVTIHAIGLFDPDDRDANDGVLKRLARATGGERYRPRSPSALIGVCQRIARLIRSGYTIGYVPPDRNGTFHRVRVEIRPKDSRGLVARTKPGYVAGNATLP